MQNSKLCSICSCPFSWNYFSPQWYRTHTAQWDIQSIFRSPSSQREEERTKKFLSTLHHWFWSPAKAFHLQNSNSHISAAPADNEDNCFIHFVKAEMKRGQSKMMPSSITRLRQQKRDKIATSLRVMYCAIKLAGGHLSCHTRPLWCIARSSFQ